MVCKAKKLIKKLWEKLYGYGKLVMFSHTIFSFSFAAVALLTASGGRPRRGTVMWAVLAFLGARTGANALNRLIDASIDVKNPRTAGRQIPKGEIGKRETLILSICCFLVMVYSAYRLNILCLVLSPLALCFLCIYSYTKRFTWCCHLILGFTCSIAPVGAWLAVTGSFGLEPLLLAAVNCLWTAGFDIIYGAQDYAFDKANGLHSIPVRFGVKNALRISTGMHIAALLFLFAFGFVARPMGVLYGIGCVIIALLMIKQHKMVTPEKLQNANIASYNISRITSIVLLVFGILDIYL